MCESQSFVKKEGRRVHIQGEKIFTNKSLVVSYGVNFFWSSFRKNLILMLFFKIFSNEIFIIVVLQLQFLLIMLFFNWEAISC